MGPQFGDLAKDMVASGEVDQITNVHLRKWMTDIGTGNRKMLDGAEVN